MNLELTRPWALTLLAVCLPLLLIFFVRSLSDFPHKQRILSVMVRGSIVLLLILSLAGLTCQYETKQQYFLFVIDRSLSIGREGVSAVNSKLDEILEHQGDHRLGFMEFNDTPGFVQETRPAVKPRESSHLTDRLTPNDVPLMREKGEDATDPDQPLMQLPARISATVSVDAGTDIAAAIETACGHIPPGYVPRLVLLSDGNETHGDAISAAAQSEIPIDIFPLPARSEPEVQVFEIIAPAEVRQGEPFFVEVTIHSNHNDEGLVEIFRGNHKVVSERRPIKTGENSFRFQQSIDRERLAAFTVQISGMQQDTLLDNNSDSELVYAAGRARVLIIESEPNLIRELAYGLDNEGIQTDIRPPEGMPKSLSDLQNYDLLILSNVPATSLTQRHLEITRTFVAELGGGFIMLGGEHSFGLGGYYKSTLEDILPVRSDFQKEKETPSLAMVISIDKSGSMSGEKIEMAKSAARSAVELIGNRNQIAVLAFDNETIVVSQMQQSSGQSSIDTDIARLHAGGGTTMYPSMEMAYRLLQATSAKLKHVILLTDGVSSPGDFDGITREMVSSSITVSSVAVGSDSDTQLLKEIARVGRGRYYFTSDPARVPQIFAKETMTAGKSAIDEEPFLPQVIQATHALRDIDMEAAPFLLGYVVTRPKPTSEVILATESGDPLLAWWRYGLGITAVFTSDAKNRWAAEWMTWPDFSKFWTQVTRQVMRTNDARGTVVKTNSTGRHVNLTLDAAEEFGRFLNDARVELTIIDPQLRTNHSLLSQTAPGRYAGEFSTKQSGTYHMELAVRKNGQVLSRQSRGLTVGYSDELRIRPTNKPLLKAIAQHSGGTYNPPARAVFSSTDRRITHPAALWSWLLSAALVLLPVDVALRRINFSLHWPFARV